MCYTYCTNSFIHVFSNITPNNMSEKVIRCGQVNRQSEVELPMHIKLYAYVIDFS